ncbi:hypothetical protein CMT41_10060 [Colwellia sp. MT41]|uniref:MHYT domain-containing protein n=1 Tax=Colwellia sp. MT41 TaxID=58049 RepID=UPI00071792E6|nr:MHYT domain-containing protein [Colwellia sp. MT41]ALO35018.1 hypothetical protein CMT41_10060 [Colwellia sp. MT41]
MDHKHFFSWGVDASTSLIGSYDPLLVLLSYIVAAIAGFCALNIINFIRTKVGSNHYLLKVCGGAILGLGVWSMHFMGMLAFSLPIPVFYDLTITLISILPAIFAAIVVLHNISKPDISYTNIIFTALLLALGIASMHFIGMSAMSMQAYMSHDVVFVSLSVLTSWFLAVTTLLIKSRRIGIFNLSGRGIDILAGLFFGFSVATMHYLAMAATLFFPDNTIHTSGIDNHAIGYGIIISVVLLMALLMAVLFYKQKIKQLLELASTHHKRVIETIDNMQDGFVLSDENGIVILVNTKFIKTFAHSDPKFVGVGENIASMYQRIATLYFEFSNDAERMQVLELINHSRDHSISLKVQTKDGGWWLLRQNKTFAKSLIQTWTDITEQTSQEQELIAAKNTAFESIENLKSTQDELVEAKKMASLASVVTGVAHELNTPLGVGITALSSIKDIIENLQKTINSGKLTKSKLDNNLDSIYKFESLAMSNFERVANLIQQFRYISVDQQMEDKLKFQLDKSFLKMMPIWQQVAKKQNISINTDIPTNITLFSYENAIFQVLTSFVTNSLEHAFAGQSDGEIHISAQVDKQMLRLTYSDNGCGVNTKIVSTIFDPFVTTNRNAGAMGLGLHISYNLVHQLLKGKIRLGSDKNSQSKIKQTLFIVEIPLDLSAEKSDSIAAKISS